MNLTTLTALADTTDARTKVPDADAFGEIPVLFSDVLSRGTESPLSKLDLTLETAPHEVDEEEMPRDVDLGEVIRGDKRNPDIELEANPVSSTQRGTDGLDTNVDVPVQADTEVVQENKTIVSAEEAVTPTPHTHRFLAREANTKIEDRPATRSPNAAEALSFQPRIAGTSVLPSGDQTPQLATSKKVLQQESSHPTPQTSRPENGGENPELRVEQRRTVDAMSLAKLTPTDRHLSGHTATLLGPPMASSKNTGAPLVQSSIEFSPITRKGSRFDTMDPLRVAPDMATPPARYDVPQVTSLAQGKPHSGLIGLGTEVYVSRPILAQPGSLAHDALMSAEGPLEHINWDVRPLMTAGAPTVLTTRPDLPPHVAQQIAEALHRTPNKPLELVLNPPELGRVRMVLSPSDAGIIVSVVADRPETLDLMRRNIEDLGRSFAELGYEDISFSFAQGDQTEQHADAGQQETDAKPADPVEQQTAINIPTLTSTLSLAPDGVDIRL